MGPVLSFDRRGSGPPLVLLHGIGSYKGVWAPVLDRLAAVREVIAIDLPGFGDSPMLGAGTEPTAAALGTAVVEFVGERLGHDRAHYAGNSLGGWVSYEIAKTGRALSATGLSPGGFYTPRERVFARESLAASRRAAERLAPLADRLTATAAGRALAFGQYLARPGRMPGPAAAESLRQLARCPGWWPTLHNAIDRQFRGGPDVAPTPVTVAWGMKDRLLLPRQAPRAVRELAGARFVAMHGVGHVPMYDDPDLVIRVLLDGSSA